MRLRPLKDTQEFYRLVQEDKLDLNLKEPIKNKGRKKKKYPIWGLTTFVVGVTLFLLLYFMDMEWYY